MPWVYMGYPKGGGWSKGWGKGYSGGKGYGGGGGKGANKPQALPEGFEVDTAKKFVGTVDAYYRFSGYGFIIPEETGVLPGDKVFVYWKHIHTSDRYPSLVKDMQVEFTVAVVEKQGVKTLQAQNVSAVGGGLIAVQDTTDEKKTFVGGQNLRYTGTLKFFLAKQGYGYIKVDPGYQYDKEGVPEEIRVETTEMNCGGANPAQMEEMKVEFGIWLTRRGVFKAYNVTLPGGAPLPALEEPSAV
eukprot:CAMPEP_0170261356 /NCGR_PEP_ID=MMETSP0116_2-20130129/30559_1 /TAXON_ID=400756 /ORGANISM="Durinskia baltica, Strain CSIRO CS-38" /LENGTH=242 /DNA_ID=CAMNT_0010512421 /DNA_START=58 /DNA_END=786 /DNA_ORIENTATION=+